jgi:hypothetical protein
MTKDTFTRYICWDKQPLSKIINKEAVSIDRAVFLATHTPFNTITYIRSPRQIKDTSESQLLEELLQRSRNDEHTFVVMQGIHGTGKSHLIRWLKERYAAESQDGDNADVVLLIERANSSLRQTLSQIVNSGLFDSTQFANQIKKLENATQQLSDESLADTILNNLQVATREVDASAPRRIRGKVDKFLLDHFVRQELKKEGAAIERIRLFLSGKTDAIGLAESEFPKFMAEDFEFSIALLRNIREDGHRDTCQLADNLRHRLNIRQGLAEYLNQLIPFTIERTTALSANDLKQMFYDLRRELKQQGKNLVLFIEDISVFTGLDAGLVDVLVTQHTGEGGRAYCRLTSVVGITDAYYRDSFPDNIKDRITHHLTLNMSDGKQALLLKDEEAVANMAARYLNALRLTPDKVQEWAKFGAKPEELPNGCQACPHRNACHAAFDAVALRIVGNEETQVGLYPFNKQVLWKLYQGLDTKTPRAFLSSILEYILQSHGPKVKNGQFPPPARELASNIRPPTLRRDAQRRLITSQAPSTSIADRIESLILFWGDRTVNQTSKNEQVAVGNLYDTVFRAFDLPFIKGDTTMPAAISTPTPLQEKKASQDLLPTSSSPQTISTKSQSSAKLVETPIDPIIKDIQEWRSGSILKNYADLTKWLAGFVREYIDWESYQISLTLVDDKVTGRRFVIEGQSGRASGDRLFFPRTDELAFVLQALTALHQRAASLPESEIGEHLITLSNWIEKEKARIIEFTRRPLADLESPKPLLDLLVQTNLMISCLGEDLTASQSTFRELYLRIMKTSNNHNSWQMLRARTPYPRSKDWRDLMQGIKNLEADCREELQILVNCRQGTSRTITFIDSASVLDAITAIKKEHWGLPPLSLQEIATSSNKAWKPVSSAYDKLQALFMSTIQQEKQHAQALLDSLNSLLGEATPKETFAAIEDLFDSFRNNSIPISAHRFVIDDNLTYRKLANRLEGLQSILNNENVEDLILSLSGAGELLQEAMIYVDYFEQFIRVAKAEKEKLEDRINNLESQDQSHNQYQETVDKYDDLAQLLESTIGQKEDIVV